MKNNILRHNHLPGGIHEFIFLTDKRQAIDLFFDTLAAVFECSPKDRKIRYIIDWSQSGVPNLNYMFLKTKEWGRNHREVAPGRCVVFFDQKGFLPIGKTLAMLVMRNSPDKINIMMEHIDKYDEGLAWLLEVSSEEVVRA